MSNNGVLDLTQIDKILDNLNEENRKELIIKSLQEGARTLRDITKDNLIKELGDGALREKKTKNGTFPPMITGVKYYTKEKNMTVKVSIMGEYRLKWFETGTRDRYKKIRGTKPNGKKYVKHGEKGAYTGKIEARHFFYEARQDTPPIEDAIIREMSKELNNLMKV